MPSEKIYVPIDDAEAAGLIGEGVHAGLRKGSEAPSSGPLWRAISESKDSAWSDALRFCVWGLGEMGYKICRETDTEPVGGVEEHSLSTEFVY